MRPISRNSSHYVILKWRYDHTLTGYCPEWACISEWDIPDGGRLRREMRRVTYYHTEAEAQRWARKYKVECPMPDPVQGCEKA